MRSCAIALLLLAAADLFGQAPPPTIDQYPVSGGSLSGGITTGPDGALWFTQINQIGRITTAGAVTEYVLPNPLGSPLGITAGPDGALWFTYCASSSYIGRITTAGAVTEYPVPLGAGGDSGCIFSITTGPDGNLWFAAAGYIGKMTSSGSFTQYVIPSGGSGGGITTGPDGALWFTESNNSVGRITTTGSITEYPGPISSTFVDFAIAAGPDGALWAGGLSLTGPSSILRITTSGSFTEYALPPLSDSAIIEQTSGITTGPDGNLWFVKCGCDGQFNCVTRLGNIITAGIPTIYLLQSGTFSLLDSMGAITLGPDQALWFVDGTSDTIGQVILQPGSTKPVVLIVPGIFGTKLASDSQVIWLSNQTINDTLTSLQDLQELEYDSTGNPVAPLSVQALYDGTDYGGLFNLSSDSSNPLYDLKCTLAISTILAISGKVCDRTFNVYNSLVSTLATNGFTYDVFPYDWREDIGQLAEQLDQKVSSLSAQYPGRTISLVAHSMGGLIVGEMLANYGVRPLISHVITLGAPFLGATQTYFELRGWFSLLPPIVSGQQTQEIGENWTAAYEMLPQRKFVYLQNGDKPPVLAVYNGTYSSTLFPALPRSGGPNSALKLAVSVWNTGKTLPVVPQAYAIVGSGFSTLTSLTDILSQGTCLQGVYGNGDNTVPINSALGSAWVPATNVGFVKAQHQELPESTSALEAIVQILTGNTPTTLSSTPYSNTPQKPTACEN